MTVFATLFAVALGVTLLTGPLVGLFCHRVGLVDKPDRHRKLHSRNVALGGGVTVLSGIVAACLVAFLFNDAWLVALSEQWRSVVGATAGFTLLVVVGLYDDIYRMRGRNKLVGQILAAILVAAGGTRIDVVSVFGGQYALGVFGMGVTVVWLLATINSFNLVDGADGLATTLGIVLATVTAGVAMTLGQHFEAAIALILAGALLGFLMMNRPPARMFLGDSGSMSIGLLLGTLAVRASTKGPTTVLLATAVSIWSLLFFDVAMAIARRKLTGRSIFAADRAHLHHVLLQRGWSEVRVAVVLGLAAFATGIGAMAAVAIHSEAIAIVVTLAVLASFLIAGWFGRSELRILSDSVRRNVRSVSTRLNGRTETHPAVNDGVQMRIYGRRDWDRLWKELLAFTARFNLVQMQLNISIPSLQEEFHATWKGKRSIDDRTKWNVRVPIQTSSGPIGHALIVGDSVQSDLTPGEAFELLRKLDAMADDVCADAAELATAELRTSEPSATDVKADLKADTPPDASVLPKRGERLGESGSSIVLTADERDRAIAGKL